jgi:hypothetical protein
MHMFLPFPRATSLWYVLSFAAKDVPFLRHSREAPPTTRPGLAVLRAKALLDFGMDAVDVSSAGT